MSNIYIQEPPTNGKVLMKTSLGDIDIELWSKEAPKACRNFVQLCMEKYYDGTIFHRIVKGFIAQGGDPTGTGSGGESIYGEPFKDEFHQRLKFNRRGLVAMANAGANDNGSQFFFTLDRTDELNKKHTIFGKVTGNTIYNMIRFNDLHIGEDERPNVPPKIIKCEVLSNPFDDIEPRKIKKDEDESSKTNKGKIKSKSKATKNYKLLSFGEEAEEDEEETEVMSKNIQIKSSHDVLNDPKLSTEPAVEATEIKQEVEDKTSSDKIRDKLKINENESKKRSRDIDNDDDDDDDDIDIDIEEREKRKRRKALQDEAKLLKKELRSKTKEKLEEKEEEKIKEKEPVNELMRELISEKKLYKKKQKENKLFNKGGSRENQTLALLAGFEQKLSRLLPDDDDDNEEEEDTVDKHKDEGIIEEDIDSDTWMTHKLNFEDSEERAKDANMKTDDWYDIYDPRNPMNQRKREKTKKDKSKR